MTARDDGGKPDDSQFDWRICFVQVIERSTGFGVIEAPGELQAPTGEIFTFPDFMGPALYLNVAMTADAQADQLRHELHIEEFITPAGPHRLIPHEHLAPLYDFIEQSAISAIFSFQALEAYSNFIIDVLGEEEEHMFKYPGKSKMLMGAPEILKCGETMEKLKTIVPDLLKVKRPTGEPFWTKVWEIKRVRDALTHLKYRAQYGVATAAAAAPNLTREDPGFVFYNLVAGKSKGFPRSAVELLDYFTKPTGTPRWLRHPLTVYGMAITEPKGITRLTLSRLPPS